MSDQHVIRTRFAKAFRYIVSQRLMPKLGGGRVAAIEILISTLRTREYVDKGEKEGKTLVDAMRDGAMDGMQHFDKVLEEMIREKVVDVETGLAYSTNAGNMRLNLADFFEEHPGEDPGGEESGPPPDKPEFEIERL